MGAPSSSGGRGSGGVERVCQQFLFHVLPLAYPVCFLSSVCPLPSGSPSFSLAVSLFLHSSKNICGTPKGARHLSAGAGRSLRAGCVSSLSRSSLGPCRGSFSCFPHTHPHPRSPFSSSLSPLPTYSSLFFPHTGFHTISYDPSGAKGLVALACGGCGRGWVVRPAFPLLTLLPAASPPPQCLSSCPTWASPWLPYSQC